MQRLPCCALLRSGGPAGPAPRQGINSNYGRRPAGLETLAAALVQTSDNLEDAVERYLILQGYLERTPRGRVATERAKALFSSEALLWSTRWSTQ